MYVLALLYQLNRCIYVCVRYLPHALIFFCSPNLEKIPQGNVRLSRLPGFFGCLDGGGGWPGGHVAGREWSWSWLGLSFLFLRPSGLSCFLCDLSPAFGD
jgi:hypothetical protein